MQKYFSSYSVDSLEGMAKFHQEMKSSKKDRNESREALNKLNLPIMEEIACRARFFSVH